MKTSDTDFVTDCLMFAGRIKRYHSWPVIQNQTVGEHCWQVALIYQQLWGDIPSPVEKYIRLHDVAELVLGDIPFPAKANNPDLKAAYDAAEGRALTELGLHVPVLHPDVRLKVKICDLLEMMCFGMVERELGNTLALPIIIRTREVALKLVNKIDTEGERNRIYAWSDQQIERHHAALAQTED
jgi:hypothetical protein